MNEKHGEITDRPGELIFVYYIYPSSGKIHFSEKISFFSKNATKSLQNFSYLIDNQKLTIPLLESNS